MQISYTAQQQVFREQIRDWLSRHVPSQRLASFDTEEGFAAHRDWERVLHQGNYGMVTWPKQFGGRGCDLIEWLIFEEEYYAADAPGRVSQNGIFLLGPTLMEYGTEEQKARYLPAMASGDEIWAQAWSEPGAGSDMAAIRCRADRDANSNHYVINGQKIWSSRAVYADMCFGLFRTNQDAEKPHQGLSMILLPLSSPGVNIRPIRQLDGDPGFAEIFFDDVRVPAQNLLGPEHQGWRVAMATAGFERGLMLRSPARFQKTAARLLELLGIKGDEVSSATRAAVVQSWMDSEAYAYATYETASKLMSGEQVGAEASCNKIFWSELDRQMHRAAVSLCGAVAELETNLDGAIDGARWLDGYMFSLAGPIYAGANEIQRNIISERLLGLPR